ncbi:MAG: glycerophosphoryl diester phosphodiesterase membrane domain-containing protein [Proteobacteria bacterium]|nr:glycerophosphoryl diester phosphodiesterase membrane domain-containing protein [Pseudomonadota bacterium]
MLHSLDPLPRPLMIGEVLDAGFRLFQNSLLRVLPLSAALVIASQWPSFFDSLRGTLREPLVQKDVLWWLVYLLAAAFGAWMAGGILRRQVASTGAASAGAESSLRHVLLTTLPRVPGAIVLTLLVSALLFAPVLLGLAGLLPAGVLLAATVACLWLCGRLALALPLYWCEGRTVASALRRSFWLVRGHYWRLFAIVIVALTVMLVFFFMLAMISTVVAPMVGLRDLAVIGALQALVAVVVGAVAAPLATALAIVVLQDFSRRAIDAQEQHIG